MTLTEFLEARFAEDEAAANRAASGLPGWEYAEDDASTWGIRTVVKVGYPGYEDHHRITFDREGLSDSVDEDAGPHIARHDPARVLAECEAKRRILALLDDADENGADAAWDACAALAAIYADHPDYQPEWRP